MSTVFTAVAARVLEAPSPAPTGVGPGGIDWSRIHPDPSAVPRPELFYTFMNGLLYLGAFAAGGALMAGLIAFGVGPLFGAHIVSDRGRSMMWKGVLIGFGVGSFTAIMAFLLVKV
ncbi:hypothetical protein Ato02nite_016270 [Paractinoplanes toevensis]|uniref:Uncharacterized protein n=1 Tax=Paractinoplanes toevensis TaxID=571911 RepID=A0A919T8V1_9ACTN|nr:hypothetical protein Ato02nite_016270 [Actinoplanes toevensis]